MLPLSQVRTQLTQEYFPRLVDLREEVQISYWADIHLVSKNLLDLLPFGKLLGGRRFFNYTDYLLTSLAAEARRNLLYWTLGDVRQFNGEIASQINLFYEETFFWCYVVPRYRGEIIDRLRAGHRIRFLSRFQLTQTQVEVEFNEIRALQHGPNDFQLVYTDSREYTYLFTANTWETNILNNTFSLINPNNYTLPITEPNALGREIEFANRAREYESEQDLSQLTDYWGSVDTSRESTSTEESRASTPISEYIRARNLTFASPAPEIACLCGTDLCTCARVRPDTPATPPYLELWDPTKSKEPIKGLHYDRQ